MDRNRVTGFLGEDWEAVNRLIRESLKSDISLLNTTNENILAHNGKMLRPMLCLLMARVCGGQANKDSCKFAAAAELLHNATLLHDDVADESTERRGIPTTASILGGPASVLLGDFWLVKAVDLILSSSHSEEVVKLFSKTLSDLAEGEMLQLQKASAADTSMEDYFRIIYSKTASLFEAACVSSAISVEAPEEMRNAAKEYGRNLGIAFQIKDDIMDYEPSDNIGKPTGVDLREQKITLPLLGALKHVSADRDKEVRSMIRNINEKPDQCELVREFVLENKGLDFAGDCLEEYVRNAKGSLSILPECEARAMLESLAEFTAYRKI